MSIDLANTGNTVDKPTSGVIANLNNQRISTGQYTWMIIGYVIGTAVLFPFASGAGKDSWAAGLLGLIESTILIAPYFILFKRFQGKNLSDINDLVWGKHIGKLITFTFIWYTLLLCSKVSTNYFDFIKLVILNGMPEYPLDVPTSILLITVTFLGIEVIARYTMIAIPISLLLSLVITVLTIPYIDVNNIRPILGTPLPVLVMNAHGVATFPFAEVVAFTTLVSSLSNPTKAMKYTYFGVLMAGLYLIMLSVRNTCIMGDASSFFEYPSFSASRTINIAGIFTRMEFIVSINIIMFCISKLIILFYIATKTTMDSLKVKTIRTIAIPFAIIVSVLNHSNFSSSAQNILYAQKVYPFYALPFIFIIPLLTLIVSFSSKKPKSLQETN